MSLFGICTKSISIIPTLYRGGVCGALNGRAIRLFSSNNRDKENTQPSKESKWKDYLQKGVDQAREIYELNKRLKRKKSSLAQFSRIGLFDDEADVLLVEALEPFSPLEIL